MIYIQGSSKHKGQTHLYVCTFFFGLFSAVRINVRPYMRSFPVTDKMLCAAITGSVHRISSHRGVSSLQAAPSKHRLFSTPCNRCEFMHVYITSEPMNVVFWRYLNDPYGIGWTGPQSMYSQTGATPLHSPVSVHFRRDSPRSIWPASQWYSMVEWML